MHDNISEPKMVVEEEYTSIEQTNYSGFWIRSLASILDVIFVILFVFSLFSVLYILELLNLPGEVIGIITLFLIFGLFLYYIFLPASKYQGTFGKQICKIYIGDQYGNRISIGRSFLRFLCSYLSGFIYIGYLLAAFTPKKQTLHDLMTSTYVYKK